MGNNICENYLASCWKGVMTTLKISRQSQPVCDCKYHASSNEAIEADVEVAYRVKNKESLLAKYRNKTKIFWN